MLGLQAFAEYYRQKTGCKYVTAEKQFYEYSLESGMYESQNSEVMIDKISREILNLARFKKIHDELVGMRRPAVIKDILTHLKVFAHTDKSFFDKKGNWIHCLNGVVEFENGSWILKPFSPEYHSRNRCNLICDPQADCPRFKEQLLAPLLDTEDIGLMQKAFAQYEAALSSYEAKVFQASCFFAQNLGKKMVDHFCLNWKILSSSKWLQVSKKWLPLR